MCSKEKWLKDCPWGPQEMGRWYTSKVPLFQESQARVNPSQLPLQITTGPLIQVNGKLRQMEEQRSGYAISSSPGAFWEGKNI